MGGAASAANLWGGALSVLGQNKANNQANQGYRHAENELGTPPIFMKGGPWWNALTGPNNLLAQNAQSLLSGNSLDELQPALRSASQAGVNNQQSFAQQLARSGLTGSGFGLGGNYAIQNQTDVNKANILAQLPALQRANLNTLFPYFSRYLGNQEFRAGGRSGLIERQGNMNAASTANRYATAANAISGMGGAGGAGGKGGGGGGGGK